MDTNEDDFKLAELQNEDRKIDSITPAEDADALLKKIQTKERQPGNPEQIIEDLGGCGKFQIRLTLAIHLIKTVFCFSFTNLIVTTASPIWWCMKDSNESSLIICKSSNNDSSQNCYQGACRSPNNTKCEHVLFDNSMNTIVSDFNLICEYDFIPSMVNSLQLAGTLTGNVISGQLADMFGRKPPFFTAIILVLAFSLVGFFSFTWQMFAVSTFFTGLGHGFFITTQYSILSEYTLSKWRVWVVGFPSLALEQCLFSLVAWLLHDWRYLQLVTALIAVPCLFSWFVIPESFRWYIAQGKLDKATKIIRSVANYNKCTTTNIALHKPDSNSKQKYSFLHLFKTKFLTQVTLLSMINWTALGVVGYGISFGIQSLSGNLYLNLFLFCITSVPSRAVAIFLSNRIGRRKTSILFFAVVGITGITVGILQTLDVQHKDMLTNVLAIVANTSIGAAWGTVQTMTVELYPTVIRNIGFGTLSLTGGIGAIIGPQLVYLNAFVPGLLFYVCGTISLLCVLGTLFLPETKGKHLDDKLV
ncbi:organic cation/carnitine transporter 2-like isoform X2 [Mercenaria mercenaria]|nr:organic cation/carnitine transporter 2-like isoform X2 [Mercenaria mercenaria]